MSLETGQSWSISERINPPPVLEREKPPRRAMPRGIIRLTCVHAGRRLLTLRPPHSRRTVAGRLGDRILRFAEPVCRAGRLGPPATGHATASANPFVGSRP